LPISRVCHMTARCGSPADDKVDTPPPLKEATMQSEDQYRNGTVGPNAWRR
jgi:hypothetical protein